MFSSEFKKVWVRRLCHVWTADSPVSNLERQWLVDLLVDKRKSSCNYFWSSIHCLSQFLPGFSFFNVSTGAGSFLKKPFEDMREYVANHTETRRQWNRFVPMVRLTLHFLWFSKLKFSHLFSIRHRIALFLYMYYIWLPGGRSGLLHRRTQRLRGLVMNSQTNVVKRDPHEWTVTKCVFVMNSSVWIAMIEWNKWNCISHAKFDLSCCFCCCLDVTVLCSHSQSKSLLLAIISKYRRNHYS